jgi:hypothetical protein
MGNRVEIGYDWVLDEQRDAIQPCEATNALISRLSELTSSHMSQNSKGRTPSPHHHVLQPQECLQTEECRQSTLNLQLATMMPTRFGGRNLSLRRKSWRMTLGWSLCRQAVDQC